MIDTYTAYVLNSIRPISKRIPQYTWPDVKVLSSNYHERTLGKNALDAFVDEVADHCITIDAINQNKKKFVMIVKDNGYFPKLLNQLDDISGVKAIYSMWEGHLKKSELEDVLMKKGIELKRVHTSGHAPVQDLKKFVESQKPKCVIPIHTFFPKDYLSLFPNAKILQDGEELVL